MGLIVCVLVLITGHIARSVDEIFPTCDSFPLAGLIEALLVRPSVLGRIG